MTLTMAWDWEPAGEVRVPELAATWSRLQIDVAGVTATLVEERSNSQGVRKSIDVPTYPLAEWLAINWWRILAPRSVGDQGISLTGAGDGFPWPDLTLAAGHGYVAASLKRLDREPYFVRFLSSVEALLDADRTTFELARFIDATVRRLEDFDIRDTLLQQEWNAVTTADTEEQDFALVAAAMGFDPYDVTDAQTRAVLALGDIAPSTTVAIDMASSVTPGDLVAAEDWLSEAARHIEPAVNRSVPRTIPLPVGEQIPPWLVGYERARAMRREMGIEPDQPVDMSNLVSLRATHAIAPPTIAGLVAGTAADTTVVLARHVPSASERFTAARALGRRTFEPGGRGVLLTNTRRQYSEKVERAFAAEFLAPAAGVASLVDRDYSGDSLERVARHFAVGLQLVEHQIENQLMAA